MLVCVIIVTRRQTAANRHHTHTCVDRHCDECHRRTRAERRLGRASVSAPAHYTPIPRSVFPKLLGDLIQRGCAATKCGGLSVACIAWRAHRWADALTMVRRRLRRLPGLTLCPGVPAQTHTCPHFTLITAGYISSANDCPLPIKCTNLYICSPLLQPGATHSALCVYSDRLHQSEQLFVVTNCNQLNAAQRLAAASADCTKSYQTSESSARADEGVQPCPQIALPILCKLQNAPNAKLITRSPSGSSTMYMLYTYILVHTFVRREAWLNFHDSLA